MRKNIAVVSLWVLGGVGLLAFGYWRYRQPPLPRVHVALLYDRSESLPQDCDALVAMGQKALTLPYVRAGSTLTLFVTSDHTTGNEPILVATYPLAVSKLATESSKRLIERQTAFLEDLRIRCLAFSQTKTSPIYRSIKQAVAHLTGLGTGDSARYLLVRSDLEETVEPAIKRALDRPRGRVSLPSVAVDNEGIQVLICGAAEVVGETARRAGRSTDWAERVWSAVFTHPGSVRFQPYCSKLPAKLGASH